MTGVLAPGALADVAVAIVLGAAFGLGACCLLAATPRWGAASLSRRIAPYVRDIGDPRGATPWSPAVGFGGVWAGARARFGRLLGGADGVDRRLRQAGWAMDVGAFRGRQLAWAIGGLAAGGVLVVALTLAGRFSPAAALVPPVLAAVGLALCVVRLTWAARARARRIEEELPTVLEFLALCLAAGEGLLDSLRRVGAVGVGDLTSEVRGAVVAVGTGSSLSEALTSMSQRLRVTALSRAVDHLVAAIDRGAPLAHVLQAQASDAREDAKRGLIEQAGRKEILMLLPLVFLLLPLSVVFAVFPGIFMLRLGIG
ncbi:MAG: type II secretion system F family protein [Microbacterium sp.]|uniref:type II secretion system F family protein n=1 Tax=Microbacterium sp. TaxID=51671 RepID=UPI0039E63E74